MVRMKYLLAGIMGVLALGTLASPAQAHGGDRGYHGRHGYYRHYRSQKVCYTHPRRSRAVVVFPPRSISIVIGGSSKHCDRIAWQGGCQ